MGGPVLTVWVALLPDAVHSAVGVDAQEEAPVFTVEPLGVLEVARREGAAAAVVRQGGHRGDAPGGHGPAGALPGSPGPWRRAGSRRPSAPASASDPLRGAAPAPAPQPPARRPAATAAGPQPRATRPCPLRRPRRAGSRAARERGFGAPSLRGRHSREGRFPTPQRPGSGCSRGHGVHRLARPGRGVTSSTSPPPTPTAPTGRSPPSRRAAPCPLRARWAGRSGRSTQAREVGPRGPERRPGRGGAGRAGGSTRLVPPEVAPARPRAAEPR